jgi:hypothetical protein
MARGPIVIAANDYGGTNEEAQRGPRLRHGTKRPNRMNPPRPGKRK